MSITSGLPNSPMNRVQIQHKPKVRSRFSGLKQDILQQAVHNVAPNLWPVDLAKLDHHHPHTVRSIEMEYGRLVEVMK